MLKVFNSFEEMMAVLRHKDENSSLKEVEEKPKKKKSKKAKK